MPREGDVAEAEEVKSVANHKDLLIRNIGRTRNATTATKRDTHQPIALKQKLTMTTNLAQAKPAKQTVLPRFKRS